MNFFLQNFLVKCFKNFFEVIVLIFFENLSNSQTEEEVKNIFAKFFNLKLDTKNKIDLYTPQILFEFKLDANLKNISTRATCIAQTLYYLRRLKFGLNGEIRKLSNFFAVITKNFALIAETKNFSKFYTNKNFDWDLAPSSPCKKLVAALADNNFVKNLHIYNFSVAEDEKNFIDEIKNKFAGQTELFLNRKIITENNFFPVFEYWQKLFGEYVENGRKSSEYFITDIEIGKTDFIFGRKSLIFRMSDGSIIEKFLPINDYKYFWDIYEKISNPREVISIRQKMDRMTEPRLRRFTGEFFTPINFANKAADYLSRVVGENWFKSGNFRLWDMCAGTGNLEFAMPAESWKFCYISTLNPDDANYCKKIYPDATVFQYDYLNDDVEKFFGKQENIFEGVKLPEKLYRDLQNPDLKWIIFINPPYAMATNNQKKILQNKSGVSMTKIRDLMTADNLGKSSQELFSQFIYRISKEFKNKNAWLGIFSTLKYVNAEADQIVREKFFQYKFESGFTFSSKNFDGCNGQFPVGFLIWNLAEKISLDKQKIILDVFNSDVEKIATKSFSSNDKKFFLNKWFQRPKNIKKFPPMKSGLNFGFENQGRVDRVAENFLAGFMIKGNDFLNQNSIAILSGPYASHAGYSITEKNFEKSMIIHAVRRIPKATWLNDRDQFMQPLKKISAEFISDCVIWSLFSNSNQTVSLRNVEYEGEIYRMKNNLYPFKIAEVSLWENSSPDIKLQIAIEREDRFAAEWIFNNKKNFSAESLRVLNCGREIYKDFYKNFAELNIAKWKIFDWDAGWYQVRMSLKEIDYDFEKFSAEFKKLGEKILPQIYELGFLRDEVKYF